MSPPILDSPDPHRHATALSGIDCKRQPFSDQILILFDGVSVSVKALVAYVSKYGNTKIVAGSIAEEMRRMGGIEATVVELKRVRIEDLGNYDLILIGGPTHFGGPTRRVTNFIETLSRRNVSGLSVAVFDTYLGTDFEKSVKRMEEQIRSMVPGLKIIAPGLSIRVADMKGPIVEGELAKCKDFARRLLPQPATA